MVQWDKDSCADAGFLKIDLLGLGMLSAVERCVELIARERGERIDLSRIPFDDPDTFRAIREADTVGVFQIESRAQMQSLLRTRPQNLDDLTIQVAIVRPGPIQGGAVNPYIERRQRLREDPDLPDPLRPPVAGAGAARDARHDHLPGPGDGGRPGLRRLHPRRGRRAAPGDEPQALRRAARALPRALRGGRRAPRRRRPGRRPSGCGRWSRASPASASPSPTAPPSGCSPTSRPGCGSTTARSSCARCSTSSRWASTPPTASSTRPSSRGHRGARARRQRLRGRVHGAGRGRAARPRLRQGTSPEAEMRRRWSPRATGRPVREPRRARRPRRGRARRRWSSSPGRAPATGWPADRRRRGRTACGSWRIGAGPVAAGARPTAADGRRRGHPAGAAARARPRRPRLRPLGRWQRLIADYSTSGGDRRRPRDGGPAPAADGADARHQRPARAPARTAARWRSPAW